MGISAGSLTIKRLKLTVPPSETPFSLIQAKLQQHKIDPIDMDETREESIGWCHPFTGEPNFADLNDLVFENCLVFGLRIDTKKVPSTLFKMQIKAALAALGQNANPIDAEDGKVRVPKRVKDAIKDRIRAELMQRALPNIKLTEIVWRLDTNELWLVSPGKTMFDAFVKMFTQSFSLSIVQINSGTMSVDFDRLQLGLDVPTEKLMDLLPINLLQNVDKITKQQYQQANDKRVDSEL